jgi:S1-C subfamily serine protease
LLLFSTLSLLAYSIPEIVAKTKPAVVEIVTLDQKGSAKSLGTGFFVSSDGQVVTNRHVIEGAASIAAVNNNGAIFLFERVVAVSAMMLSGVSCASTTCIWIGARVGA